MSEVLVFIDWYLPGFKAGGPVTSCSNMVAALRKDFRFSIVTSDRDYCEEAPYPGIERNTWIERAPNERVMYLSPENQTRQTIQAIITQSNPDTVYINGVYSLRFSIWPLLALKKIGTRKRIIVAGRGMLAQSAIGVKRLKKTLFLRMARMIGLYRNAIFHATNDKERADILRQIGNSTEVVVVPNIPSKPMKSSQRCDKMIGKLRMVSIARIAPEKNLLFLLEALQKVKSEVELTICGSKYDEQYWEKCAAIIDTLPENISVRYAGFIEPDRISETIRTHHVLVLPSLGENYGHVIAESLMAGRPVIISDQTPWKQLESKMAGFDLPLESAAFVQVIERFAAMDNEAFQDWVRGAERMGEELKDNQDSISAMRRLFLKTSNHSID